MLLLLAHRWNLRAPGRAFWRRALHSLLLLSFVVCSTGESPAGQNPQIQLALDVQARDAKRQCWYPYSSCEDIQQVWVSTGYTDVVVVAYHYYGIRGLEYGLDWSPDGLAYFYSFHNCADFIIGGVDLGGYTSIAQSWASCQYSADPPPGTAGLGVGWLELYIYGPLRIDIVQSDQGALVAVDCNVEFEPIVGIHPGFAGGASPEPGDLPPCEIPADHTWYVPQEAPTIQAGIDSASAGDTVLVACGTYTWAGEGTGDSQGLIHMKSGVCLRSETGEPDCVTIDGELQGRVLFCGSVDSSASIEGFNITGGSSPYGGGAYCDRSSLRISNCTFQWNWAGGKGGGIACLEASPGIDSCTFWANMADKGGAISCEYYSSPTILRCVAYGNQSGDGSGLYCLDDCFPTVTLSTFYGNEGSSTVEASSSTPRLDNCIIAFGTGEAVFCVSADATLTCCDLYGNAGGDWVGCIADQYGVEGNISADPCFCEPDSADFRVHECSPCADVGACGEIGARGVGCYSRIWHVATAGSDSTGDGTAGNPFRTIQHGIDRACSCDTVEVASGTYAWSTEGSGDLQGLIHMKSGVYLRSETRFPDCVTIDAEGQGRVFYCSGLDSTTMIEGFTIENGSKLYGGGAYCDSSFLEFANCVFSVNMASADGGAVRADMGAPTFTDCIFSGNHGPTGDGGGGIFSYVSSPRILSCTFSENSAVSGGAIKLVSSPAVIEQCVFAANSADMGAGIICAANSLPSISSSSFYGNEGPSTIHSRTGSTIDLDNCIIAFGTGEAVTCNEGNVLLECCDVYGNSAGDWVGCIEDQYGLNGNFSADPCFCDPEGANFYLHECSPCIDVPGCGLVGALGAGCSHRVWHVSTAGSDSTGDGTEVNPFRTIQYGIDRACSCDTVEVASGTYAWSTEGSGDSQGLIRMKSGVYLRSETGEADSVTIDAEGQGRVFYCAGLDSTTIIEGFTIENGSESYGGGAHCDSSFLEFANCTFSANIADDGAGVMATWGGPTFTNCTFSGNHAPGGGIHCYMSSARFEACNFSENSAVSGGAIGLYSSPVVIDQCVFAANSADHGAGICAGSNSLPSVSSSTFYGNEGPSTIHSRSGSIPQLDNCIIAFGTGEAVTCDGGDVVLACCDAYGNSGGDWVGCIADQEGVNGNFSAEPCFCDPEGGDFHLHESSPCADAPGCGEVGALGVACYVRNLWVDTAGSDSTGDGTQVNPFRTIQHGIDRACTCDTVVVMGGTYYEHDIAMKSGLLLRSETGNPDCVTIDADSSGRVIACFDVDSTATIEGFTITGGAANYGAGMITVGGSPSIRYCIFTGNVANLQGGGLSTENGSPTVSHCTFVGNACYSEGGALYCFNGAPSLENTIIAHTLLGEAVFCAAGGTPSLACCDIFGNAGGDWEGCIADQYGVDGNFSAEPCFCDPEGGDFHLHESSPCADVPGCVKVGALGVGCSVRNLWVETTGSDSTGDGTQVNPYRTIQHGIDRACVGDTVNVVYGTYSWSTEGSGDSQGLIHMKSGVYLRSTSPVTIDAEEQGRAIYCAGVDSTAVIEGLFVITGGYTEDGGGAILCDSSSPTIRRCVVYGNQSLGASGLLCENGSSPKVTSCTFFENQGPSTVDARTESHPELEKCILAFDSGKAVWFDVATVALTCCDVYGNAGGDWVEPIEDQYGVNGNFSADPCFCDREAGDYLLHGCSPCWDAPSCGRIGQDTYGAGCYAGTWHVALTGSDSTGDGTSGNPYRTIQRGIDRACSCDTVVVADGTYTWSTEGSGDSLGLIRMKPGVYLRSETGEADCVTIDAEDQGRIFYCAGLDSTTIIEGFTIRDGSAFEGGGVYCDSSSLLITDCTFLNNDAPLPPNGASGGSGTGGGACVVGGAPTIRDCIFSGNWASSAGGGVHCAGSSPYIEACTFSGNSSPSGGGALNFESQCSGTVDHCIISNNSSSISGSGLYCLGSSSPTVSSSTFYGNEGSCTIHTQSGSAPELNNCIIAFGTEEAVSCQDGTTTLSCCDVFGNSGGDWVGCIAGQYGLDGNISLDPFFCDPENDDFTLKTNSPCAPDNSPGDCDLIGALGVGCARDPITWRVPTDAPTIQAAIDSAISGDSVLVAAGTYTWTAEGTGDSLGLIRMKSGVILASEAHEANSVIIDAEDQGRIFYCPGADSTTIIEGFTIRDGNAFLSGGALSGVGGGILCESSSPEITGCIVYACSADGGGGLYCGDNSSPALTRCSFHGNGATVAGGIYSDATSSPTMDKSIIAYCARGEAVYCEGDTAVLSCSDLYGNFGGDWVGAIADQYGTDGNFSADPLFCDAEEGDLSLSCNSPCAGPQLDPACGEAIGALDPACNLDAAGPTSLYSTVTPMLVGEGGTVSIVGTVSDTIPGGEGTVVSARLHADSLGHVGWPMEAQDGSFDESSEGVSASLVAGTDIDHGAHTLFMRGEDGCANWGDAAETTIVVDLLPPAVVDSLTEPPAGAIIFEGPLTITVTFNDSLRGNTVNTSSVIVLVDEATPDPPYAVTYGQGDTTLTISDIEIVGQVLVEMTISTDLRDAAGNALAAPYLWSSGLDTIPPAAPLQLTADPDGWTNLDSVSISWPPVEDPSGIAGLYYRLDQPPDSALDGQYLGEDRITQLPDTQRVTIGDLPEGEHTVYIWLEDGFANASHENRASVTCYLDQTPPVISPRTPAEPLEGTPVQIEFVTLDDALSGLHSAQGRYREAGGDTTWQVLALDIGNPEFQIPGQYVTRAGVEYSAWTRDVAGNENTSPDSGFFALPVRFEGEGISRIDSTGAPISQPHGIEVTAYRMVSMPLELEQSHPGSVLVDDLGAYDETKWKFGEYRGDDPVYFGDAQLRFFSPGRSFFLIVSDAGKIIDSGPGLTVPTDTPFPIPLELGWNMVANPFTFAVPLSLISRSDEEPVLLYELTGDAADPWTLETVSMEAWTGYVLHESESPGTLLVYPGDSPPMRALRISRRDSPPGTAPGPSPAKSRTEPVTSWADQDEGWVVSLRARAGGLGDSRNYAGVLSDASDDRDYHDLPDPPGWFGWTRLYFPHESWPGVNYSQDLRVPTAEGHRWDFEVTHGVDDVSMELQVSRLETIPDDFHAYLLDLDHLQAHDIRVDPVWEVLSASGSTARRFALVIGTPDFVGRSSEEIPLVPMEYRLRLSAPNPFSGATMIRYDLPRAGRVVLGIYDVQGRLVRTLVDEGMPAGYHAAHWDGTDDNDRRVACGMYFQRLSTPGFTATRKMLFLK